ncbi:MAG: hypothetical protein KIH89_002355, partial [Candidatus Shapirobacteria bacterium]|nr:hypothetical protein [Candidatus Shapirobacteria bacterium]
MENNSSRRFSEKIIINLARFFFLALLVFIFFWFQGGKIIEEKIKEITGTPIEQITAPALPPAEGPREMIYTWKYAGKSYTLNQTLYDSFYIFYTRQPKVFSYSGKELPKNWEEKYFAQFLSQPAEDKTLT